MLSHQKPTDGDNTRQITPQRQVFVVISNQHLTPTGGIGSFARGIAEMGFDLGWTTRVVTDRPPIGPGKRMINLIGADCIYGSAEKATPTASRFAKAQVDPAKTRNFHRSLLAAQSEYGDPDLVLVCTPEAVVSAEAVCWAEMTEVVFYTHHENLFHTGPKRGFDKFDATYDEYLRGLLK